MEHCPESITTSTPNPSWENSAKKTIHQNLNYFIRLNNIQMFDVYITPITSRESMLLPQPPSPNPQVHLCMPPLGYTSDVNTLP